MKIVNSTFEDMAPSLGIDGAHYWRCTIELSNGETFNGCGNFKSSAFEKAKERAQAAQIGITGLLTCALLLFLIGLGVLMVIYGH